MLGGVFAFDDYLNLLKGGIINANVSESINGGRKSEYLKQLDDFDVNKVNHLTIL